MKIQIKNYVPKFQEGGPMEAPAQEEMPVDQGGQQDPMAMLIEGAVTALQNQDCNTAMQVCQILVQMAQGGGSAPEEGVPENQQPVYKAGGKLSRWIKK